MKKLLLPIISAMLCAMLVFSIFAAEAVEIKMTIGENTAYVNGEAKELDAAPVIRNDRTMLPISFIAENLGATVTWDETASAATITAEGIEIKIEIGAVTATVNGEAKELDSPAFIENGRTYMPVRFIAQALGAAVDWNGDTSTATLTLGGFTPFPDDYVLAYPDNFDYTAANLDEYVKLGQYKGLTLEGALPAQITDEDVKTYIDSLLAENPEKKEITDRAAQVGDHIIVNFVGKVDGVAFDGGTAENYEITLGNGGFIEGFEEGMIGMKVGETKAVEAVFPENYQNTSLAGKTAIFDITLLSVYEEIPATLTDEYVKDAFGYSTVKEFEEETKATLTIEREVEIANAKASLVMANLFTTSEMLKYPEGLVEDYMYQQISSVKESAAQYGMPYELILLYSGYTVESFEEYIYNVAQSGVAEEFFLMAIAKAEGITATKEECDKLLQPIASNYGFASIEEFCALIGQSADYFYNLAEFSIMYDKVQSFIIENNTFVG